MPPAFSSLRAHGRLLDAHVQRLNMRRAYYRSAGVQECVNELKALCRAELFVAAEADVLMLDDVSLDDVARGELVSVAHRLAVARHRVSRGVRELHSAGDAAFDWERVQKVLRNAVDCDRKCRDVLKRAVEALPAADVVLLGITVRGRIHRKFTVAPTH